MMKLTKSILPMLLATAIFSGEMAFADSQNLAGHYRLLKICQLTQNSSGGVTLPAGQVVVSENIPVSDSMSTPNESPAILFQSGGSFRSALTLTVGRVAKFAFGREPFSIGTYSENGMAFLEQYASSEGGGSVDSSIRLEKITTGLRITSLDQANREINSCTLVSTQ